jgi:hypothetical protein
MMMSGVSHQPTGAAFDLVLLLHVGCVVVALATTVTAAAMATRVRRLAERSMPLPESVARYYKPGVNWAGRTMWGIPIFGFALLAMSQGAYDLRDSWVTAGLGIFAVLALLGEGVLWPVERRLQSALVQPIADGHPADDTVSKDLRLMARAAVLCVVLLLVGTGLMLAQP